MSIPGGVPTGHTDLFVRSLLPKKELWPEFDYSAPHLCHYPDYMNAAEKVIDNAIKEGFSDKVALYYEDAEWTYADLYDKASRIARILKEDYGVVPGNRILLRSTNSPMLAACWLAVLKVGGICVTTMSLLRAGEISYIADTVKVNFALCEMKLANEMEKTIDLSPTIKRVGYFTALGDSDDSAADLDKDIITTEPDYSTAKTAADDIALVTFTSGTTGHPKAAIQFHRDIISTCDSVPLNFTVEQNEIVCAASSLAFTYGLCSSLVYPLYYRASTVLIATPTPETLLTVIEKHKVTSFYAVPTLFNAMLPELDKYNISSLVKCSSAGETIWVKLWNDWLSKTGIRIVNGIGSTEFMSHFLCDQLSVERPISCGKPIPGYTVVILDDEGKILPRGNRGLIAVKGPTGCRYLGDEARQKEYVRNGWNITNDVFDLDEDGFFLFVDRADNLIVSSGYNISPQEVEEIVVKHPDVLECAVVGVPDDRRGKVVMACVILNENILENDDLVKSIQDFVKKRVAPYKYPRIIRFYNEFPRTGTGKLQRFKLIKDFSDSMESN